MSGHEQHPYWSAYGEPEASDYCPSCGSLDECYCDSDLVLELEQESVEGADEWDAFVEEAESPVLAALIASEHVPGRILELQGHCAALVELLSILADAETKISHEQGIAYLLSLLPGDRKVAQYATIAFVSCVPREHRHRLLATISTLQVERRNLVNDLIDIMDEGRR